jgi:TRAP-type C4-dicarboxylate transport system permease small subunit
MVKDMEKNKLISFIDKIEEILLVSMFALMVLIIFVQVIMRYIFNNSLSWSEELGKFLFVWLSWIGISIGAKRNEHIKITMLTDKLSPSARKIVDIISEIIVIAICSVTTYYGISLVISQAPVYYAGIKISMSWGYLSVVVGCILMILRSIISIISIASLAPRKE